MSEFVEIIPVLDDNYVFLIGSQHSREVTLIDPGEFEICSQYLKVNNFELKNILITHHHSDHIDGIADLKVMYPDCKVYAPLKNENQISNVDFFVQDQQQLHFQSTKFEVLALPGHTLGIVGYYETQRQWLFSGDVLFGLGCGRLFEGTPEMLFASLQKIKSLPGSTQIFCTHEYTATNLRFTEMLIQEKQIPEEFNFDVFEKYKLKLQQKLEMNQPSVFLSLEEQMQCNIFLLSKTASEIANYRLKRNHFSANQNDNQKRSQYRFLS